MKQWKCAVCGQVFEGDAPPVPCPVCGAGESAFSAADAPAIKIYLCTVCGQTFEGNTPPVPCPVCGAGESAFIAQNDDVNLYRNDTMDSFVLIGGGAASLEAAKAIRARNRTASIKLICGEGIIPYNRPALSDVVADGLSFEAIALQEYAWYEENRIELICDAVCSKIIPEEKTIILSDKRELSYTKLLIATGAVPFIPPIETDGSIESASLRTFAQADWLLENIRSKDVIVIGGGILGVEAALALRERGCRVKIVELAPRLMNIQADEFAGAKLQAALRKYGVEAFTGQSVQRIANKKAVLSSGEELSAELILFCVGVRADITLAQDAGLLTQRGIIVNSRMQTNNADIYAAGDCAQFEGRSFGLYSAALSCGKTAGAAMAGEDVSFTPPVAATSFEGAGFKMFSAGEFSGENLSELTFVSANKDVYKKLYYKGKALVGAVLCTDVSQAAEIIGAIENKSGYNLTV